MSSKYKHQKPWIAEAITRSFDTGSPVYVKTLSEFPKVGHVVQWSSDTEGFWSVFVKFENGEIRHLGEYQVEEL